MVNSFELQAVRKEKVGAGGTIKRRSEGYPAEGTHKAHALVQGAHSAHHGLVQRLATKLLPTHSRLQRSHARQRIRMYGIPCGSSWILRLI